MTRDEQASPTSDGRLPSTSPQIAVALSGGGTRAALFGLGVLLYLVDSGLNKRVSVISSVSGGSITNGFIAQECDFRAVDRETFDPIASDLLRRLVERGLFFRSPAVWAYVVTLVMGVAALVSTQGYGWPVRLPTWAAVLAAVALGGIGLLRGVIVSSAFSRWYFTSDGAATPMSGVESTVEHLFCATDIVSSAPFYFSTWDSGYVYSPALGFSKLTGSALARTTIATAVRASAAFPGGIPPKRLRLGDVRYEFRLTNEAARWQVENTRYRKAGDYQPRTLFLADGGVWNNLGTEPLLKDRLYHGLQTWNLSIRCPQPELRIVVANASAPVRASGLWRLHLPLWGELGALMRSMNILNTNTVAPRADLLREQQNCVVVSITDTWDRAVGSLRAGDVAAAHPEDEDLTRLDPDYALQHWPPFRLYETLGHETLARACSAVPTILGRIPRQQALWLVIHAYQNAQAELYVKFGCPRPNPRPSIARFTRLFPQGRTTDGSDDAPPTDPQYLHEYQRRDRRARRRW